MYTDTELIDMSDVIPSVMYQQISCKAHSAMLKSYNYTKTRITAFAKCLLVKNSLLELTLTRSNLLPSGLREVNFRR